jgi:hypothetical protein
MINGIIPYLISDLLSKKVYPPIQEPMGFVTVAVGLYLQWG